MEQWDFRLRDNPRSSVRERAPAPSQRQAPGGRTGEEKVARLAGIEPTTLGFGGQYSIH